MIRPTSALGIVVSVLLSAILIEAFPNGAPPTACRDLLPQHPFPISRSLPPYKLVVNPIVQDGKNIGLKISVENSELGQSREFRSLAGFLVQVREAKSGQFVGKLGAGNSSIAKPACNSQAALTHKDNGQKAISSLQFVWEPLQLTEPIQVRVYATFVKTAAEYWNPTASEPFTISP